MKNWLSKINSDQIVQYLQLNQWVRGEDYIEGRVREYLTPTQDDALLLPMENTFTDYYSVIYRALSTIADYEKITVKRLYTKLVNPSCDLLSWRIKDETTEGGAISFNSMFDNISSIKYMLSASCLDVLYPSQYHSKVNVKEVQEQLSLYKFGQTEVGSYILNVLCPLGYYQYQLFDPDQQQLPLSRRVNLNIMDKINGIQRSVEEGSQEMRDKVAGGEISVNFLNSLADLYEINKDAELSITAAWNKDIPLLSEPVSQVSLNTRCMDGVLSAVEEFTPKQEQNVNAVFFGKIINIGAEAELDNRKVVDIKVATIGENMRTITVNATLNYSQYIETVQEAFNAGLDVKLSGTKTSTARTVKLSDASIEIAR